MTVFWPYICLAILCILLVWLSVVDLRTGYLPDPLQAALAVSGLIIAIVGSPVGVSWVSGLAGAAVNGGIFWALRWLVTRMKGREAMGLGDVKLVAAGGLWLGPWGLAYIMAAGGLLTLLGAGIVGLVTRKPVWQGEMPLGPGLAVGILGTFVAALLHISWLNLTPISPG